MVLDWSKNYFGKVIGHETRIYEEALTIFLEGSRYCCSLSGSSGNFCSPAIPQ